jgi:hypothetical protein
MSLVSAFVTSMHAQAAPMIGQESVVIGATTLSCTLAEIADSKEFGAGGFEKAKSLTAVCLTSALPATEILKKAATARGESFRVETVSRGAVFSTITLEQITKA